MRLFTAIELPDSVRGHLARLIRIFQAGVGPAGVRLGYAKRLDSVRWVRADNLHVTLKFLGDVSQPQIDPLVRTLQDITIQSMQFVVDRLEFLPPSGRVRVIAGAVGGETDRLTQLFNQIDERCEQLGFASDRRAFRPHITIGRIRGDVRDAESIRRRLPEEFAVGKEFPGPAFEASSFSLIASELSPGGSIYTRVARFPSSPTE